jgi:hypothetical protein
MRIMTATLEISMLLICLNQPIWACTIFKVTRQGTTLVGNNEDDNNQDTKVWFLVPESGKYGRVFFGYNDAIPQGGMNDHGLFFDWVADNWSEDWKRDPNKLNYAGSVSEKILEEAASVEEALRFYQRYNETAFLRSRAMLVDKTGASAIVGWNDGKVAITRGDGGLQVMGWGREPAQRKLGEMRVLSIRSVASALSASIQDGEYPTQYSNVYDLQRGDVYVYLFHQKLPAVKLNLKRELGKGNHFYNIPRIASQMRQPLRTDHKTQPVAKVDPAVYAGYVGRYRIDTDDYLFTISSEGGRLYYEAQDASRIEIYPSSSTRFFLRSLEGYLIFEPGKDGHAHEAILHAHGKDKVAERVSEAKAGLPDR